MLPPSAPRKRAVRTIHGVELVDEFGWLREKESKEVLDYLDAENHYADANMSATADLRRKLYDEMLSRIKQTDDSAPYRLHGYLWYTRTEEGKQYPMYARRRDAEGAGEEVILDLNLLASGHAYCALGEYQISDDGELLAYSIDYTGFREYTLYVKNLRTGELLPDRIEKVDSVAWLADNRTLLYVTEDDAKRPWRLLRHLLGTQNDEPLLEENDELYRLHVERSLSRRLCIVTHASSTTTEVKLIDASDGALRMQTMLPRREGHEYYVEDGVDLLWIFTNDGAKDFRLVTAPPDDPMQWTEVLPHRKGTKIEGVIVFESFVAVIERSDGLAQFRLIDRSAPGSGRVIEFPEPAHEAFADLHLEYRTTRFRYGYQSFVTPPSTYEYDVATRETILLKQLECLGDFDPSIYQVDRLYAEASDGTKIPLSMLRRKDRVEGGPRPMVLYGYGSYGIPIGANFSSNRFSLVDRGVTWVIAHIRGGGELGEEWHDAGKMGVKQNTFTDFIASAEHLIDAGLTDSEHLAIMGGSAGGLLMGAVLNLRPELFRAVVALVPFVDVVNTMLDPSLPLTVGEYLEWGNPNEPEEFHYIHSYDPYSNIREGNYPAILVRTSLNDSQVMYWEAAKYVAKLRLHKKNDDRPLLLKINMGAGHSGSSGRYDLLHEVAFDYAFILRELDVSVESQKMNAER
jgi:oligopeptidase B